jgi:peptidoglycan-N-acetylglucosamine deacetylase
MTRPMVASVSIDLDDKWSYLKTHGDASWQTMPSFLDVVIPRMLSFLDVADVNATFFVVGRDASHAEKQDLLRAIPARGHEVGNHSYNHEPWLCRYGVDQTREEIGRAHEAIQQATGQCPIGFRGPGYSLSAATLRTLRDLGYRYDASTLPTWIGPVARAAYVRAADLTPEERRERGALFGTLRDGLRPLRPYRWGLEGGELIEIPVTTMPLSRLPIHFTYLLYLSAISPALARKYLRLALMLCELRGIGPSMLLHPLEFLDPQDVVCRNLGFLPGTATPYGAKRELLFETLDLIGGRFAVRPMVDHVDAVESGTLSIRAPKLAGTSS